MAITRTQAAAYLHGQFSAFASLIGQSLSDDTPNGYGADIDNALRDLETTEANIPTATVDEADRRDYFTLAEYYSARRMWLRISAKANSRLGPASVDYKNVIEAIKAIMEDAAGRAASLGYTVSTEASWALVRLNLDYIEPEACDVA